MYSPKATFFCERKNYRKDNTIRQRPKTRDRYQPRLDEGVESSMVMVPVAPDKLSMKRKRGDPLRLF